MPVNINSSQTFFGLIPRNFTPPPLNTTNLWMTHRSFITNWYIVMVFLSIIGSAFNILLFLVFKRPRKSLRGSQILIGHMIILDLTICAVTNPLFVSSVFFTQFIPLSRTYCRIVGFLYAISISINNWLSLSLAINRSVALLHPTFYPKLTKTKCTLGMTALGWLYVLPYFSGFLTLTGSFEPAPPWGACSVRPFPRFTPMYNFDIAFPLCSAGGIYIVTLVIYKIRSRRLVSGENGGVTAPGSVQDRHLRTVKMLVASYLWYVVCSLPSALLAYVFTAYARRSVTAAFYGRTSTLFAYATNPVSHEAS